MRALALTLAATMLAAGPALAGGIEGVWKTAVKEDGRYLHVRIAPCTDAPGKICGTIDGAFGGADEANVGKPIIWDMAPSGENEWDDGTIWAPDDDKTYDSRMELHGDRLKVSGCVLMGLICRGQEWTRVP